MSLKLKAHTKSWVLFCGLIGLIAVAWYWCQKKAIVGFWRNSDGGDILEFRGDGTFSNHRSDAFAMVGRYSYRPVGRNNLKLELSGPSIAMGGLTVSIKRDVMTTTTALGVTVLKRVDPSKTNTLSPEEEIKQRENQLATIFCKGSEGDQERKNH